jgi:CheY-like chemotaxis protein
VVLRFPHQHCSARRLRLGEITPFDEFSCMSVRSTQGNERFRDITIAVVDDDEAFLDLVAVLLAERGYRIVACRDSVEAFAMLERERVDLVVLDLVMETAESGWDILRALRLHPVQSETPVIVCSADIGALRANECLLRDWGVAVLHKPFNIVDFYALLDDLLERDRWDASVGLSAETGT